MAPRARGKTSVLSHPIPTMKVPPRSVNCRGLGPYLLGGRDMRSIAEAQARFWSKVEKTATCWFWQAGLSQRVPGWFYGQFTYTVDGVKRNRAAHRLAYEWTIGPIPEGHHLHHTCGNTTCVNPEHLEPVTPGEHLTERTLTSFQSQNARKTHCPQGHPYDDENTYLQPNRHGGRSRVCRECLRQAKRKWRLKKKMED